MIGGGNLTATQFAAHQRSKAFRAAIDQRASQVKPREIKTYFIPNTPYGVPKVIDRPALLHTCESEQYRGMWFFDLIWPSVRLEVKMPQMETIIQAVCKRFGISKTDLISDRRTADISFPRQVAMYLCKIITHRSLPELGRKFGGRDHTTVLHAVKKIEAMMAADDSFAGQIHALKAEICS